MLGQLPGGNGTSQAGVAMKLLREGLLERASQPGLQEVAWPLHMVLTHILWRLVSKGLVKRGVA